jgi:oligosaccharide repeat unit polymerase
MTLACALLLLAGAAVQLRWSGSILFPSVLFGGLWGSILLGLAFSGDDFYQVSLLTLGICMASVASFTLGSVAACRSPRLLRRFKHQPGRKTGVLRILDGCLVGAIAVFPLYVSRLMSFRSLGARSNFFQNARAEMVLRENAQIGYGPFSYVMAAALVMTLIAIAEYWRSRKAWWRPAVWMAVTLAYYLLTGSRLGAMVLTIASACVVVLAGGRLNRKITLAAAVAVLSIFSFGSVALGKGGAFYAGVSENVISVAQSFRLYALGGIVACDQRLQDGADTQGGNARSFRFFYMVLRSVGINYAIYDPVERGIPTPQITNVYSIYYNYFRDFGWLGMPLVFAALGALCAFLYRCAVRGRPECVVLYSLACGFLVFTCSGDPFLLGASACIQATVQVYLVYGLQKLFHRDAPLVRYEWARPATGGHTSPSGGMQVCQPLTAPAIGRDL